ncbi:hypothetical protein LWI28_022529 [Acer negundo]|uniref:Tetratricopeptide SHNi-TPR domain-containing protein n=1 Tax=Acer negundo TaxID=4023 RepID=A0AAD5IKA6_ACENE|nr:hypothetical protein LWI28_022529 [Acer negundo]
MAEEEASVTMTEQEQTLKVTETLETNNKASVEATIESAAEGATESTCNNNDNVGETSGVSADDDREKTVEFADELIDRGRLAFKESDYSEASDCFSRALEIRVAHYGELAVECLNAYYQFGRSLLYKAQEEADPLGSVPKKEVQSQQDTDKDGPVKSAVNGESSISSASSNAEQAGSSNNLEGAGDDVTRGKDQEDDEGASDDECLAEADEDESDLDLAWKMLDVARAIAEKHSGDTMEKVDILSALGEVSLEREDIETSLSDYQKALSILERLVEPDSRLIAELNFRICLCLEIGSKLEEAIPYCQKAISICKSRVQRLMSEVKSSAEPATSSAASELDDGIHQSSNACQNDKTLVDKEAEIETLTGLAADLEKKLEDLQQMILNPRSILSEILGMAAAKTNSKGNEKIASSAAVSSSRMGIATGSGEFDSPTASTAHTNAAAAPVTHLGTVGRGVKRVSTSSGSGESTAMKKPALDP